MKASVLLVLLPALLGLTLGSAPAPGPADLPSKDESIRLMSQALALDPKDQTPAQDRAIIEKIIFWKILKAAVLAAPALGAAIIPLILTPPLLIGAFKTWKPPVNIITQSAPEPYYPPPPPYQEPPAYSPPAYSPPAPAYSPPAYSPPAYDPPAYSPPAYSPPQYRRK